MKNRPIRVLQVVGVMNRGGAEVMLMNIIRDSDPTVQYTLLVNQRASEVGAKGAFDDELRQLGCDLYPIKSQGSVGVINYIRFFKDIADQVRPDVVHIHLNAKSGVIAMAARMAGIKRIIVHCHANIKFRGSFTNRIVHETEMFLQKILIGWYASDFWGCSAEANRRLYWPWLWRRSVVINNAIDAGQYINYDKTRAMQIRETYGAPPDSVIIGNVGRIVSHKNIAFIIDVIAALKAMGQHAILVVAGRDDDKDYVVSFMVRAQILNIADHVRLLGERSDIPEVMASFDIFAGTSFREGFGLVAVEAQAAGIPCILSSGFPRTVDIGMGTVVFEKKYDVQTWANTIVLLKSKRIENTDQIEKAVISAGFDSKYNTEAICQRYRR